MKNPLTRLLLVILLTGPVLRPVAGAAEWDGLKFQEVFDALKTRLPGMTEAELQQVAINGLVEGLRGRVVATKDFEGNEARSAAGRVDQRRLDGDTGYFRIGLLHPGTSEKLDQAHAALVEKGAIKGLVLDLRFSDGHDYPSVMAVAGRLLQDRKAMLGLGEKNLRVPEDEPLFHGPIAVLVNRETAGAAEALAAVLREHGQAVVLGQRTAGRAFVFQEVELSNGKRLRVAADLVKLDRGLALSSEGLVPDIPVEVDAEAEKRYFKDPYAGSPNLAEMEREERSVRSEAELVRRHRENQNPDVELPAANLSLAAPGRLLQDPVLARAVDLLKGLARLRAGRH